MERRAALVLAAEDYTKVRALENPVNDARAMEAMLETLGFEVWLETDRDLKRTRRALEDFRQDAEGADVALVFFAGMAWRCRGANYLLPTDADAASSQWLAETSLSLAEAGAVLAEVAPMSIVPLDARRNDPFTVGGDGSGRGAQWRCRATRRTRRNRSRAGADRPVGWRAVCLSAAPGETASDGDGKNSPFTAALLRHFATKGVELKSALTLVQQDVYDRSRGKQLPYIESGLPQMVFISEQGELPERDQLLMAMADLTPELRDEVEAIAAQHDMPLAPLYAALISGDLARKPADERHKLLLEAASSYGQFLCRAGEICQRRPARGRPARAKAGGTADAGILRCGA
ncbi:MAG: caspase family protein [Paracoccaceae bacterium]